MEYLKQGNETKEQYYIRLYENKEKYGLTFEEIGTLLNEVYGVEYNEAKWRRPYQGHKTFIDLIGKEILEHEPNEVLKEIELAKLELQKETWRKRDANRENEAKIRRMARLENTIDFIHQEIKSYEPSQLGIVEKLFFMDKDREAMIVLSDWHLGADVKGRFNEFNDVIANERITKLFNVTMDKVKKEQIDVLHIANLGDLVHGVIHVSTKIQSEMDVIQQIIKASDYLQAFIKPFLDLGISVKYYNVVGNHGRVTPNKNEVAGIEENFEKLILEMLNKIFYNYENFESIGCQDGLIETEIVGKKFVLAHGNFDNKLNASYRLPQLLGYVPDYIITGHIHHDTSTDYGTTMHIVNPSLIGADDYATSGRYGGRAGQKFIIFNDDDIDSVSTIYF